MSLLDACNPRIISVDDSCGCTLTRASITAMTPASFEALGALEIDAQRIIAQEKELRATGVQQKGLKELLMSRMTGLTKTNLGTNTQSIIAPFHLRHQRHNVNSNYWVVTGGHATAGAGVGAVHPGSWNLYLQNESGLFATPLISLEKYFLPGKYLLVMAQNPSTLVGYSLQYKIISAVNADVGATPRALVTVEPSKTSDGWTALSAGEKTILHPTVGVAINLANSVSDFEDYCHQYPAENTRKLRAFWQQTIRNTWCYNDAYLQALNAPNTSEYWKKFRNLPLADQRRRQGLQEERDLFNTIFYGQPINEKQTPDTYNQLPTVEDPLSEDCILEYKANTEGIRYQLNACGKVIDAQGAPLDIDLIRELGYQIKHHRSIDSDGIDTLDVFVDRTTFGLIRSVMIPYYKAQYGVDTTRWYNPGQALKFTNQVLWEYDTYEFPDDGFQLAVFRDKYFDDSLSAFPDQIKSRGRVFWMIDWSDIQIGMGQTKSVTRNTPDPATNALFKCRIQANITHYQLHSQRLEVMVQDPNRHLIIENYSGACPTLTATPCPAYEYES